MGELAGIVATTRLKRATASVRAMLRASLDLALPRLCAVCRARCTACRGEQVHVLRARGQRHGQLCPTQKLQTHLRLERLAYLLERSGGNAR